MLTHPTSERLRALGLVAIALRYQTSRRQAATGVGFRQRLWDS